jgi:hypothetical protein
MDSPKLELQDLFRQVCIEYGCYREFVPLPLLVYGIWDIIDCMCMTIVHLFDEVEGIVESVVCAELIRVKEATMTRSNSGSRSWLCGSYVMEASSVASK